MLINCPNCDARYLVQADSIGKGRKVRCANCKHVWFQDTPPAEGDDVPAPVEEDKVEDITNDDFVKNSEAADDMDSIFASLLKAEKKKSLIGTTIIIILFYLLCGYGMIAGQSLITSAVPGMQSFYNLLGFKQMELSADSLVFDRVEIFKDEELGGYLVSGYVLNLTPEKLSLPNVEVNKLDSRGLIIGQSDIFMFDESTLEAEASQYFEYLVKTQESPSDIELKFVYTMPAVHEKEDDNKGIEDHHSSHH